jgi:uncharacterized NAD(P)/FAD-binding protein YdhS
MSTEPRLKAADTPWVIAIVGGGLSGALVAIQLLQRATRPLQVVLIQPRIEIGRGIAYSMVAPSHLLNLRAGNISLFSDRPEDFLQGLCKAVSPEALATDFIQRRYFGIYVSKRLLRAERKAPAGIRFERLRDRVQQFDRDDHGRMRVNLESGSDIITDAVVLALDDNPPAIPFDNPDGVEIISGWSATASEDIAKGDAVPIADSGQTAVDAVLGLSERGHRGSLHVISCHGRWFTKFASRRRYRRRLSGRAIRYWRFCASFACRGGKLKRRVSRGKLHINSDRTSMRSGVAGRFANGTGSCAT